ncbi:hypothetical protein J1N35_021481 [Gossypium stocksii]|uniref:Uncharacterized protein n=1 Tax=Gossypium stocksii TaxID=47602 RepID=A0A9D3VEM8_9ROSI|nr:hypothetical protein J1N35_021481 [Gossypium stocksii]
MSFKIARNNWNKESRNQRSLHPYSLCMPCMALNGKLLAHIRQTEIIILVNSGSTHNFMDSKLMKQLNFPTEQTAALRDMVANGVQLSAQGVYKNIQ